MGIKINCEYNDQVAWCKHEKVKRSLWGFGARCCTIHPNLFSRCDYQVKHKRPGAPPSPQQRKNNAKVLVI
jgi:hypothetical protein